MHFQLAIPTLKLTTHTQANAPSKPSQNPLPSKAKYSCQAPSPQNPWDTEDTLQKPETSKLSGQQKVLLQAGIGQRGGYATNCLGFGMAGAGLGAQYSAGNPYIVGGAAVAGCIVGMAAEYVDESQDNSETTCTETTTKTNETEESKSSEDESTEVEETAGSEETKENEETEETTDTTEDDDDLGCVYDGGAMVANNVDRLAMQSALNTQTFVQNCR